MNSENALPLMEDLKRSEARMLATVASSGRKGILLEDIIADIKKDFGKDCDEVTAREILERLTGKYLYYAQNAKKWACTDKGMKRFEAIKSEEIGLLARTTRPEIPMYA